MHVRRLAVAALAVAAVPLAVSLAAPSAADAMAAVASVTGPQYVGDTAGSVLSLTVRNASRTEPIGAVEVRGPGAGFTVTGCPAGPAGWSVARTSGGCRFLSAAGSAGDLRPGAVSSAFRLRVTTVPSPRDLSGTWRVTAYRNGLTGVSTAATGPGLRATAWSVQVAGVVVAAAVPRAGSACPAPVRTAKAGSLLSLVVCGRNRSSAPLSLVASRASLRGTFASGGTFVGGTLPGRSGTVVLGGWNRARAAGVLLPDAAVAGRLGAAAYRTSPPFGFRGYRTTDLAPAISGPDATTVAGSPVTLTLTAVDPDGDDAVARVAPPLHGSVTAPSAATCTGTRPRTCVSTVRYTPQASSSGVDELSVTAFDGLLASAPAGVRVTVTATNVAPTAVDDAVATSTLAPVTLDVRSNDTDPEGAALRVASISTTGTRGAVTLGTDGRVTYDPRGAFADLNPGQSVTDTFTYAATDGSLQSAPATVRVTVTAPAAPPGPPANVAPTAADDSGATDEDTAVTLAVLGNDADPEGAAVSVASVDTAGTRGTVAVLPDGTLRYDPRGAFESLPAGASATDTFAYRVTDGSATSAPATVRVVVAGRNDAPLAAGSAVRTDEDAPLAVALTGTDVDGDALGRTIVTPPAHGRLSGLSGGTVTYTPAADYSGPDSFSFRVSDATTSSAPATVSVTVLPVNDTPVARADSATTDEDATTTVTVLGNDTDVEPGPLTVVAVDTSGSAGAVVLGSGGVLTYDPRGAFDRLTPGQQATDAFTYTVRDADGATAVGTVTVTVTGVNDPPVALPGSATGPEDTGLSVPLTGTDAEGATLSFAIVTPPAHGTVGPVTGGTVTYTPDADYSGPDSLSFTASDGSATSAAATVTLSVTPVDDVPVARGDRYATDEDTLLTVPAAGVLGNDSDVEADPLTAVLVSGPAQGVLTLGGDGSFTYRPAPDANGPESFVYRATGGGASSATATVDLVVRAVNDAPEATDVSRTVSEDRTATVTLVGSDVDGDLLGYGVASGPTNGTLGPVTGSTVDYTPTADYTGPDSFVFTVGDGVATATATVRLSVSNVDDPPVSQGDAYSTDEDVLLRVAAPGVLTNDRDVDGDALTARLVEAPASGTVVLDSDGGFTYRPALDSNGTDSFRYVASAGGVDAATATVLLTVRPVGDAPTASATSGSTGEDTPLSLTLTGRDVDGDALTFTPTTPGRGTLGSGTVSGCPAACRYAVTYTPAPDLSGADSFTFTVSDGTSTSAPATVSLTVAPVNDRPSFTAGPAVTAIVDSAAHTVSGWATAISAGPPDEAAQSLAFTVTAADRSLFTTQPAVSAATGDLTYTLAGTTGSTTLVVSLRDSGGGDDTSAVQTVAFDVVPANTRPTAEATSLTALEDGPAVSVTLTGRDADGDSLLFTVGTGSKGDVSTSGAISCSGIPSVCTTVRTYTPTAGANGSDTFTFTVSDGSLSSTSASVGVTITPVNDAPSFTAGAAQTAAEDSGPATVGGWATALSAGPADETGQALSFVVSSDNASLFSAGPAVSPAGDLSFTPAPDANGSALVSVRVTDDGGTANGGVDTSPTRTFRITVDAVNDPPAFTAGPAVTVAEDAGAQTVTPWATGISAGPADEAAQTVALGVTTDNPALFAAGPAVSPTGVLTFTPAANRSGAASLTVTATDSGGASSAAQVVLLTVTAVNDPPVATAKSFPVQTNMKLTLSGLLAGATDPGDTEAGYTPAFTLASVTVANCPGCVVSNLQPAGSVDVEPPADQTGSFTLAYTVTDSGSPAPAATSAPATITLTVAGPVIRFVSTTGSDTTGNGTLARPYATLTKATSVDAANDRLFVGPGTFAGAVSLTGGEWLTGAGGVATSFDALMGITPPTGTIARPAVNGTAPNLGAVTLGAGNTLRGVRLTGAPALSGSSFGTLTVETDVSVSTAGQGLALTTGQIAGSLGSVTSTGGTRNVDLVGLTGSAFSLGSGALSGASGSSLRIAGGTAPVSYSGDVTSTSTGAALDVSGMTGGGLTLSGSVSDTGGGGVTLSSNTGATFSLAGSLAVSGAGVSATGGGTVSVTGGPNTVSASGVPALAVVNTTIGAGGLGFRSLSASAAPRGIALVSTGALGGLTVTGNGGTCTAADTTGCSGGTLSATTAGDTPLTDTNPSGGAIVLSATRNVSLTRMLVSGSSNWGLRGLAVSGLSLSDSVLTGTFGTSPDPAFGEGSAVFTGLTGTVAFTDVAVSGGLVDNVSVTNDSGVLNSTFTRLTVGANSTGDGNDGLRIEGTGTSTVNANVQTGSFTSARGDLLQYIADGSGGGALTVNAGTLSNSHPAIATGGGGISIAAGAAGPVTVTVSNTTSRDAVGTAWQVTKSPGAGRLGLTFTGNTVGAAGVNSGSLEGSALGLLDAGGDFSAVVANSTFRRYNNFGLNLTAGAGMAGSGLFSVTLTGNTVTLPGTNAAITNQFQGLQLNSGVTALDSFTSCLDVGPGNVLVGSGRNGAVDFRLRQRQATTVRLPGYTGAVRDDMAVATYVQGKLSPATMGTALSSATGGGFVGGGPC